MMLSSQIQHCSLHSGLAARSLGTPRPYRSLTSLQAWHAARLHNSRPRCHVQAGSRRRGDSFFEDDFFAKGKGSLDDAKQLFAEGERMFKNGQFQQGQRLFQQAEQQLQQARQQVPFQASKFGPGDWGIPKIEVGKDKPSWKGASFAIIGLGVLGTILAGPIIAGFLAFAAAFGALALTSIFWLLPLAGVLLGLGGLFVFPLAMTLGLTVTGLGIGALAVSWFRGIIIPKQSAPTYPAAAKAVAQEPVQETETQKQQRLYEEESEKLASELREFDAQLEVKERDAYRQKLKREGLWKD